MAVTIDIGNPTDIHPRNKRDVGHRLALLARAKTYGDPALEFSGPTLDRVEISGAVARVTWLHTTGLRTHDDSAMVKGFSLAGADGVYHPAQGKIDGTTVSVSSSLVPIPHFVRYAWSDNPETNLENAAGLPAVPFRTDG